MAVGPGEIGLILLVVFLLFGARRLGDLGKGIGDGIRGFKLGIAGESEGSDEAKAKRSDSPSQLAGSAARSEGLGDATSSLPSATAETAERETEHASGKATSQDAAPQK